MHIDTSIEAQALPLSLETAATVPAKLSRPRLLAAAARIGMTLYRREQDLAGLLPPGSNTSHAKLVSTLMVAEAAANASRLAGDPTYAPARHLKLLTALLAEAAALCEKTAQDKAKTRAA